MPPTSPTPSPFPPRRWVLWAVVFAVWTLLGLLDAGQMSVIYLIADKPFAWWQVLAVGCADWYMWAALTPFVLWLARRYPFRAKSWPGSSDPWYSGCLASSPSGRPLAPRQKASSRAWSAGGTSTTIL